MNEYPHKIIIEHSTSVEDEGGGSVEGWVEYTTSEALGVPIGGSEFYQANQTTNPAQWDFYLPYRDDIKPSMRVNFRGEIYNIVAPPIPMLVDINGDYEKLCLKCSL
jgi:SPP1 family predicted phage head-tail adaptor